MYRINRESNNLSQLKERKFSELGFREREHLQEWIAKNPQVLTKDDELLIIQKEYQGFPETNERLDLLALDKEGSLVIIENKLDDTGRDVVWQALKYTSYCSTLSTSQIIKVYQEYLDNHFTGEDAKTNLMEFLEKEQEDEFLLNQNDQRIIFVANHYRKEVTSTVLWLLSHDIRIQCFRATPYSMNEDVFLQIEQIIPLPETQEFMIDAKEKQKEEKGKSKTVADSEAYLVEFWGMLKAEMEQQKMHYLDNVGSKAHYGIGFWKGKGKFAMVLGRYAPRVELYIDGDPDKLLFDALLEYKDEIQADFHGHIEWERLDAKKASRVKFDMPKEQFETLASWRTDESARTDRIDWFIREVDLFYKAVSPYWEKVNK